MIKADDFMSEIAEIVSCNNRLAENDLFAYEPDVSNGSSYDGFINFTDGFVDCKAEFTPKRDYGVFNFNGGRSKAQKERAKNAQIILDNLESHNFSDFYDWHIKDEDGDCHEFYEEFPTCEDFENWYFGYHAYEPDPTPDLFDGKHYPIDREHDHLYEYFLEVDDEEYSESPAFCGVCVKLYDEDNYHGDHKRMARVESYINDDLSYGREHVGGWARLVGIVSADGSDVGNHYIYLKEFEYTTFNDLKKKLKVHVDKAYDSLGL